MMLLGAWAFRVVSLCEWRVFVGVSSSTESLDCVAHVGGLFSAFLPCERAVARFEEDENLTELWHTLDADGSRMLTLDEFHEPSGFMLSKFQVPRSRRL